VFLDAVSREPDPDDRSVTLHLTNLPRERDRYRPPEVDTRFEDVLEAVRPDVVHVGHLNHLSTTIPVLASIQGSLSSNAQRRKSSSSRSRKPPSGHCMFQPG
jgi:hypothetical protein